LASSKSDAAKRNQEIAQASNVERLAPFADLSIINTFARNFGLDPDKVYLKDFDTVMNFMWLWKEQDEYQERFNETKRMMEESAKQI
jgi:hypothetical protein